MIPEQNNRNHNDQQVSCESQSIFRDSYAKRSGRSLLTEQKMKTTRELMNVLQHMEKDSSLQKYVSNLPEHSPWGSLADYLAELMKEKGLSKADLIRGSGLDRTYCYQIFDGSKKGGRDKIIALLMAAHAGLKEIQRGLEISEEGVLYPRRRRDAILIFSIEKGLSVEDTNELLEQFGEKMLQ